MSHTSVNEPLVLRGGVEITNAGLHRCAKCGREETPDVLDLFGPRDGRAVESMLCVPAGWWDVDLALSGHPLSLAAGEWAVAWRRANGHRQITGCRAGRAVETQRSPTEAAP